MRAQVEVKELFTGWTIRGPCDLVDRRALGFAPTFWQLIDRLDFIIDDRVLLDRRTQDTKTLADKQIQKNLKIVLTEPSDRLHWILSVRVLKQVQELEPRCRQSLRQPESDPAIKLHGELRIAIDKILDGLGGKFKQF